VTHIPRIEPVRACLESALRDQAVVNRSTDNSHPCDAANGGTILIAGEPYQSQPVLNFLYEQVGGFSAEALFSRIPGERCVYFGGTVSGASSSFGACSRKGGEAASMVFMIGQECWHQKRSCRRTISPGLFPSGGAHRGSAQEAEFSLASHLPQGLIRGLGGNRLPGAKDPDSLFLMQSDASPSRPKHDAIFRAFQFQRIAGAKLHLHRERAWAERPFRPCRESGWW
jgi:hypothetical protein